MQYKATKGPELVRNESSFTHGQGWSTTHEWRGGPAEVQGKLWGYSQSGWDVQQSVDGPYMRMIATRGGEESTAETDYYDKFSITKETLQKSIWTLPHVVTEMDQFVINTGVTIQDYAAEIEGAVEDGNEKMM